MDKGTKDKLKEIINRKFDELYDEISDTDSCWGFPDRNWYQSDMETYEKDFTYRMLTIFDGYMEEESKYERQGFKLSEVQKKYLRLRSGDHFLFMPKNPKDKAMITTIDKGSVVKEITVEEAFKL